MQWFVLGRLATPSPYSVSVVTIYWFWYDFFQVVLLYTGQHLYMVTIVYPYICKYLRYKYCIPCSNGTI